MSSDEWAWCCAAEKGSTALGLRRGGAWPPLSCCACVGLRGEGGAPMRLRCNADGVCVCLNGFSGADCGFLTDACLRNR